MSAQHEMQNPGDPPVDITQYVLAPGIGEDGFSLETHAEEGSVGSSEVTFDDPDGNFYPIGLNAYRVRETTSEAADPLIYTGAFGSRTERRGPYRTGGSRHVVAQVQDSNSGLSRFVVRADEDGNRPQETETERMEWLFTTSGMALHWDISTSIIETGSTVLSAADLTDYTLAQVLDDMAQQCGKNYYVFIDGAEDPPEALLVYAPDSGDHLTSDLRFSNVIEDVDDVTTFYAGLDWEQTINPERVRSYISVRYANGRVDESDSGTADEFSRVDGVMDAPFIKTAAVATTRALEYLGELDSEETTLKGTVYLPAAKASQFRAGMRCEMKASHLTGLTSFLWVRLLSVTIVNISQDDTLAYALAFEGTFSPAISCATAIGSLQGQAIEPPDAGPPPISGTITPGSGDYLAVVGATAGATGAFSNGNSMAADAPWTSLQPLPGAGSGATHTESAMAYQSNGAGPVSFSWDNTGEGWAGAIVSVILPTTATAPLQLTQNTGGFGGDIIFDTPPTPGNYLVLFRVAEGPFGWGADPGGADWVLVSDVQHALPNANSSAEIWVACCPDDPSELNTASAGSSSWTHCIEVAVS